MNFTFVHCKIIISQNTNLRGGFNLRATFLGETRFEIKGLPKSPTPLSLGVSTPFALGATVNGRRLGLNLIMHPTHPKNNLSVS